MQGVLYLVATPIGNLSDLTKRAIETFELVDFIAAEDTRVTVKLLNHLQIKKPLISYFEHNLKEKGEYILQRIKNGENCALCSDAGMPCISDPGEVIVRDAHQMGIKVVPIPAASAAVTAIAVSGLATGRFCFEGFIPMNKLQRKQRLAELENEKRTMIFYEAPHKLKRTLDDFAKTFGVDRKLTLARELTKIHEEILPLTVQQAIDLYKENPPRGEYVLVLQGKETIDEQAENEYTLDQAVEIAKQQMADGEKASIACKNASAQTGIQKNIIYKEITKE